tara:strand:+ start:1360 stop:1779 length:420 start_codon:yes stop_codon:yes gene_type:complete
MNGFFNNNYIQIAITLGTTTCICNICFLYYRYKKRGRLVELETLENMHLNYMNEFNTDRINTENYKRMDNIALNKLSILEVEKYKNNKIKTYIKNLIQIKQNNINISYDDAILQLISQDILYNQIKNNKQILELYNIDP